MANIKSNLSTLIEYSKALGLKKDDLNNAEDLRIHGELGLCFDTIITQLYEYGIKIDNDVLSLIRIIGRQLNITSNEHNFVEELLR
jgi:hypothetical protein